VKIYTRTGDAGETSLVGGTRVSKGHARVDACGDVDELNAVLGVALASLSASGTSPGRAAFTDLVDSLTAIQRDLFALGARLGDPSDTISQRVTKAVLQDADVLRLEQLIDRLEAELPPLAHFILPGGVEPGAALHLARTVCRRAERRMVALQPPVHELLIRYVNRLSDLLFVMARAVNHRVGVSETQW
jgi:cob(I)alamin adenosyltransferase